MSESAKDDEDSRVDCVMSKMLGEDLESGMVSTYSSVSNVKPPVLISVVGSVGS